MATQKVNMKSGVLGNAVANDIKQQIADGKSVIARYRPYMNSVAVGAAFPDTAKAILVAVRAGIMAHRQKIGDLRTVAPVQDSRVSELKSILRFGEWKCYPTVLDYFDGHDINFDDLLTVSKFVRKTVTGDAKKNANASPAKDAIMREINKRKKARRGSESEPNGAATIPASKPEKATDMIKRQTKGLSKWYTKDDGKQRDDALRFLEAINKACGQLEINARLTLKARAAAEKAAAKAEAAAK